MVADLVKTCARQFGLPESRYSTHSLKIGGPTEMLAAGIASSDILRASGHESNAGLLYQLNSARVKKPLQVLGEQGSGLTSTETLDMLPRKLPQTLESNSSHLVLRFPARLVKGTKSLTSDEDESSVSSDGESLN